MKIAFIYREIPSDKGLYRHTTQLGAPFFPLEEVGIREQNAFRLSLIKVRAIDLAVINTEIIYTEDGG